MIRRVLLYTGLAVVALVLIVVVIGYLLPQDHVATRSVVVDAPPAAVFATMTNVAAHPQWRPDVERVEVVSESPLRWKEHAGGDVITMEATTVRAPDLLVSTIVDKELPFGGAWTCELRAEGTGTRVTITERGEVYNPVFRFMSRFVFGHAATIDRYLADLRRRHATM
jgi:hypothetical protein